MPLVVVAGVDPTAGFAPSAMTKTASHQMATEFGQVNGWSADTKKYPGSTVVNNALRAQSTKSRATVSAVLPFSGGVPGFMGKLTQRARLVVNGREVETSSEVAGPAGTLEITAIVDIKAGDLVSVQAFSTGFTFGGSSSIISPGETTYVRIA
ncbi:hypothetical protein [Nocardia sp. NPDC020380]|uniref:hypothetical protein n=1 Tax=Nocardia sp. NPDC020380 TaxID=3364309 RepID=UPI00379DF3EB